VHTIGNQIIEAIRLHQDVTAKGAREQAIEILQRVGMPNPTSTIDEYPFNLSGGMRQRAMVAMALSCHPRILIADEPTTAVDVTIQAQVLELMKDIQGQFHMSIIMITHDLGVVADMANDVMVMYAGKQVEYGTAEQVFYHPKHPYTWGLLASLPRHDIDEKGSLNPISGQPPSLINVPQGCAFHPRCQYARAGCRERIPALVDMGEGHLAACSFSSEPGFDPDTTPTAGGGGPR